MNVSEKKGFTTHLPDGLVTRLKLNSLRTGVPIHEFLTEVIDRAVPRDLRIEGGDTRRAKAGE